MKTFYLLRHGDASAGLDDHERPLSPKGHEEASRVALFMEDNKLVPDFILCSSALRTQETMHALLKQTRRKTAHFLARKLYLADPDMILMQAAGAPESCHNLLVISHNPGISELAIHLGIKAMFPTCGLGVFSTTAETWAEISPHNTKPAHFYMP